MSSRHPYDNAAIRIPDESHPRGIRYGIHVIRRVSRRKVRVTGPHGYVEIPMGPGACVSNATDDAHRLTEEGKARWTPVPSRSGPSGGAAAARTSGLRRVEAYVRPETAETLRERHGSIRAALEWAAAQTPDRPG